MIIDILLKKYFLQFHNKYIFNFIKLKNIFLSIFPLYFISLIFYEFQKKGKENSYLFHLRKNIKYNQKSSKFLNILTDGEN